MDAFEHVVATILQREGFWTQTSFKVELTAEEKRKIGRASSPRWELDVVAYRGSTNEIRVVECKSYLDSPGVPCDVFDKRGHRSAKRYKLFCDDRLRKVVFSRLKRQLTSGGYCAPRPKVKLCLAAGRISGDPRQLKSHFRKRGWLLFGPDYIRDELTALVDTGYENSVEAVVAKVLLRQARARRLGT